MNRSLLLLLLLVGFFIGLTAFAPLETALRMGGANRLGVSWASAEGTVFDGKLTSIESRGTKIGDANLHLMPGALLTGRLKYAVEWTGEGGRGNGEFSAGFGNRLSLTNYDVDLDLLHLEQAARWIQQSGGRLRVRGSHIRFKGNQCLAAEGTAQSDVLDRNRDILGPGWSEMRGELRCENGILIVPLESANSSGTQFRALLRFAPGGTGSFEARVSGPITRELMFALPIAGFTLDGRDYIYNYLPTPQGNPT